MSNIAMLRSHWGFSRMPFAKDLAPSMLHRHPGHAEAVARISWCVEENTIGALTGEVGAGKTVSVRAALTELDDSRHTVIYLGNPAVGARGLYAAIVVRLGGVPRFHKAALIPQATDAIAAEASERGKRVVVIVDLCRCSNYADKWPATHTFDVCRRCAYSTALASCRHSYRLSRNASTSSAGR